MKARIKKTGELVNIAPYCKIVLDQCDSWGTPVELSPEEVELIQERSDNRDWEQRRYEIARTILPYCAEITRNILMAGHSIGEEYEGMTIPRAVAKRATNYADALIEELKKQEY